MFMLVLLSETILELSCLKMAFLNELTRANLEISDFSFLNSNAHWFVMIFIEIVLYVGSHYGSSY